MCLLDEAQDYVAVQVGHSSNAITQPFEQDSPDRRRTAAGTFFAVERSETVDLSGFRRRA